MFDYKHKLNRLTLCNNNVNHVISICDNNHIVLIGSIVIMSNVEYIYQPQYLVIIKCLTNLHLKNVR